MISSVPILPIRKATKDALNIKKVKGYDPTKTYGSGLVSKEKMATWIKDIESQSRMNKNNGYEICIKKCLKAVYGLTLQVSIHLTPLRK